MSVLHEAKVKISKIGVISDKNPPIMKFAVDSLAKRRYNSTRKSDGAFPQGKPSLFLFI